MLRTVAAIVATLLMVPVVSARAQDAPEGDFVVTLLGTGNPTPSAERMGPATLVQVNGQNLLFDSGRGASIRLTQAGVPVGAVTAVFLTHFHSDHVGGLADVWLTGWLSNFGGRTTPFEVYGPTGTTALMDGLVSHDADIRTRIADELFPRSGIEVAATDAGEGVIYERDGVQVTMFDVDHGELIKPSVGYRIDYEGRSVVISGDTRFSANLIEHAAGIDVLVHEVMTVPEQVLQGSDVVRRIMDHHASGEDAGRVFAQVAPALAVYSHLVVFGYPDEEAGLADLVPGPAPRTPALWRSGTT